MRFLHTADWQIGKPFQSIGDHAKREILRQQRLNTVRGFKELIDAHKLDFVVVCGDLFDSATPDAATVSALCSAIGSLEVPVYAIPGNHDHGGPGCIWEQVFFLREQQQLAPNFHILLKPEPVVLEKAVLLPCPLLRRHQTTDPTTWLHTLDIDKLPDNLPKLVIAHGSTQGFSSSNEDDSDSSINTLQIENIPTEHYDYIALGDWHGTKEIHQKAWYSGTPEQDRFAKGDSNQPGHSLIVSIPAAAATPQIEPKRTGRINWHRFELHFSSDDDITELESQLSNALSKETSKDLLKLQLSGTLSLTGADQLDSLLESLEARLISLRLSRELTVEPSDAELAALTQRDDPLIALVARELHEECSASDPEAAASAKGALRELHIQLQSL